MQITAFSIVWVLVPLFLTDGLAIQLDSVGPDVIRINLSGKFREFLTPRKEKELRTDRTYSTTKCPCAAGSMNIWRMKNYRKSQKETPDGDTAQWFHVYTMFKMDTVCPGDASYNPVCFLSAFARDCVRTTDRNWSPYTRSVYLTPDDSTRDVIAMQQTKSSLHGESYRNEGIKCLE